MQIGKTDVQVGITSDIIKHSVSRCAAIAVNKLNIIISVYGYNLLFLNVFFENFVFINALY